MADPTRGVRKVIERYEAMAAGKTAKQVLKSKKKPRTAQPKFKRLRKGKKKSAAASSAFAPSTLQGPVNVLQVVRKPSPRAPTVCPPCPKVHYCKACKFTRVTDLRKYVQKHHLGPVMTKNASGKWVYKKRSSLCRMLKKA